MEQGCLHVNAFQSVGSPATFAIHSEWASEEAFEIHTKLAHTVHFVAEAERLLTHRIKGDRLTHLGGGPGLAPGPTSNRGG